MKTGRLKKEFERLRTVPLERVRAQSPNLYYTALSSDLPARRANLPGGDWQWPMRNTGELDLKEE